VVRAGALPWGAAAPAPDRPCLQRTRACRAQAIAAARKVFEDEPNTLHLLVRRLQRFAAK
jgi:hypothetical protein